MKERTFETAKIGIKQLTMVGGCELLTCLLLPYIDYSTLFCFPIPHFSWRERFCAASSASLSSAMAAHSRWIRPEVFPLFAAVGVAVGICGMQLVRNICGNPEVRVTKQNRAAGILENFEEGERYAEHGLRKFVRKKPPQIMPSVNRFFSEPNLPDVNRS